MLNKQEADEKRDRWAEEVLDLLAQQRPSDAARLAREWNRAERGWGSDLYF